MNSVTPEQYQSASEIADLVATREISALEILERHLNKIEEHEKDVHAFNLVLSMKLEQQQKRLTS